MIRRKPGRHPGPDPLFIENCIRLDAVHLATSRGFRTLGDDPAIAHWQVSWTDGGRLRTRTVALPVTATAQPLGGVRRWWQCPFCCRRCGVLLAVEPDGPIACRACHSARYVADYPGRYRNWRFVEWFRGSRDNRTEQELTALRARRRRGIRRGRRIRQRANRLLHQTGASLMNFAELWMPAHVTAELARDREVLRMAEEYLRQLTRDGSNE
jgi:hypothetical protein